MYTKDNRNDTIRGRDLHGRGTTELADDLHKLRDKLGETRDAITQTASHAKRRAEELLQTSFNDMKDKSVDFQDNITSYVKSNPVKSVGFAIVAGLIVAKLLRK